MTVIWHWLSCDRHIPVISLETTWCHIGGTFWYIPVIWHLELGRHMNHIWQFMPVIWLVAWEQAAPGAAESRLKCSGTQSLDCKGVYCASASLNALVPLGSRHGVAGASHRCRRRRRWPQSRTADVAAAVVVSWLCRAALAADSGCRVQKQMTSVGTKMN